MNIDKSKLKTLWYQDKNGKGEIMKKVIILVATTILAIALLSACTKAPIGRANPLPPKGVNGEEITDIGLYGAQRICEAENIDSSEAQAILIKKEKDVTVSALEFTRLVYIIIINDTVWMYEYDYNSVTGKVYDDNWANQEIKW